MATQIIQFPAPDTYPLEDNYSTTERLELPPLIDCKWKPKSCDELWCKVKCVNDSDYKQPLLPGDKIIIQTQFLDYQNVNPETRCQPPLKPGKAVAQFRLYDKPTVVYGDPNNCIVFCYDWSFTGCLGVGDFPQLRTCSYPDYDSWREGVLSFYETLPQIGNPAKRRIGNDTLELEWDIEEFKRAYGFDPCATDIIYCFYEKSNAYAKIPDGNPRVPGVETIFPFTCCPEAPPCFGLAKVESGCSIPTGKASLNFKITDDPSYVFGAVNQASSNTADVGLILIREDQTCPPANTPLDPLLLFSNATDFSDYIDNFASWLSANVLLVDDSIIYDNTTGEFTILLDTAAHQLDGWNVCAVGVKLCEVRYDITANCTFTSDTKEVSFIFDSFTTDPATHFVTILASDGAFSFTAPAIDTTTLNDFILDLVDYFNANILGSSYAVPFSGVPNVVNPSGFNGIKIFLDTTVYTDACESNDWAISIDNIDALIRVYETNVCCDSNCNTNEVGYVSFDFYLPDPGTLTYLVVSDFELFYDCANGIPATLFGSSPLSIGTPTDWNDLLDRLVTALNTPALTSGAGIATGVYAQRFGDSIRIKIPTGSIPLGCNCETINWRIRITESAIAYYRMVENRHCCQSACTIPPDHVKVEVMIYDEPGYVFGNPNNHAWIYMVAQGGDCDSLQPIGVVKTSDVANLVEYAEAVQLEWTKFFGSFGGKTSFILEQVGSDYKITGYVDRWAYKGATGFDPCDGLKICYKNKYTPEPVGCYVVTEINITLSNLPVGITNMKFNLRYYCSCYFASFNFDEVIALVDTDSTVDIATKVANAYALSHPTWIVTQVGSKVTLKTPCSEIDPCSCAPICATGSTLKVTYDPTTTEPLQTVLGRNSVYKGCETTSEDGGTPFIINADLTQDNSCCGFCDNPFGYMSVKVRIRELSFNTFRIQINGTKDCFGGIQISSDSLYLVATSFEESAQFISNTINNRLLGDAFARADGDILSIWIRNNRDCPCDDELVSVYLDEIVLPLIKKTDCCAGSGTPGIYQSILREITSNNICCDDYLINIQLFDCNCNPLVLYNPIPECLHPGKARATFDLANFRNLNGCWVSITSLEDGSVCFAISPFEKLFDNLTSYESQLQDWVDAINLGSPNVTASRDGLKLILDFDTLSETCCGAVLSWSVICELSTANLESIVECCPTEPTLFSIFDALDGWIVGQNTAPLKFFQNLQFDPDKIPADCFAFKINDNRGNVHFTECYIKEKCRSTVLLCSEYAEGKQDCEGYVYGLPEFGCPAVIEPVYSNCYRIYGELFTESYEYATPNDKKRTSTPKYRLQTGLLPPYVMSRINAILAGKNITINGTPVTIDGAIQKNRDQGTMWVLTAEFVGEDCVIETGCETTN